MKNSIFRVLIAAGLFAGWTQGIRAAVTFTITPAAVSNTYVGPIMLTVSNLTSGDTVVVQKFGDANSNGVVDAGDLLVQQFNLTDGLAGMVIGSVTNINVPGDTDGLANGTITAKLNFPGGDFVQNIVGKYLFKLSSPAGHFSPMTNVFSVTNFPFAQKITGNVVSSSVNVPYATVIFFPAPRGGDHGPGNPVAGTVANSSGAYSIQMPPGTYVPMAFKSNYVASYTSSPVLTLNSSPITTNLSLTIATAGISGKIVDALNPGIGLPGLFVPAMNSSGLIAAGSSDTNGNFTVRVTSGSWQLEGSPQGLTLHGYVGYQNGTNINAGTTGFVGGFYKATSLFYGAVKDGSGNPLAGIPIEAYDQPNNGNGEFDMDGYSDANGNYVTAAYGGLGGGDPWQVGVDNQSQFPNYLFSQPALDQNGGTNLAVGQAVLQNFTAIVATNQITGNVQFNGSPVAGVQVDAYANIGGNNYQAQADTDANGDYSLNVANGVGGTTWNVNVYDCGCSDSDSLNNVIGGGNYQDPSSQNVNINNSNGTANFTVPFCGGVAFITTSPLPNGTNGDYYDFQFYASSCSGNLFWSVNDPQDVPSGLTLYSDGAFNGTPGGSGPYNFSVNVSDGNHQTNQSFSLYIAPAPTPLQITTTYLPTGTNSLFYSQTLQASGGTPPYNWSLASYSALPANLSLATNGVLSGIPSTMVDTYYFDVIVNDAVSDSYTQTLSLNIVNPPSPPLVITNISLPNGNVGVSYSTQLGATGGQSPYSWSYAIGSINLSSVGLTLYSSGLISGTPTTNKVSTFKVQVTDSTLITTTNKVLSITINPDPILSLPNWLTNRFQMLLMGASNQNYTLQLSTNLGSTNWTSLFVTNSATTNSFNLTDPNATNKQRFYRILIGP
jgi:hypothetical protein